MTDPSADHPPAASPSSPGEPVRTAAVRGPVTEAERARIAARYPKRNRTLPRVAAIALIVIGGIWTVWTAWYHANPAISGQVNAFDVVSDSEVTVTFTVERPDPSIAGECTFITQAVTYQQVGELTVAIPPGTERLQRQTITIKTIQQATSASLQGCRTVG